ncbi:phage major capsid protein [Bacillus seohaeanensis]|uniref:Phage major capsid protein n=1 Tax=Bacillus seohaeanensis TaxID=284580 RepID=A0ABW5RS09_9BACI
MKKIDEMKQSLEALKGEARSLNEAGKVEDAETKLAEVRSLQKQIDIQTELDKEEQREVEIKMEKREIKTESKLEIRSVFAKAIKGKALTEEERALVQSSVNTDGGYLVPKDIATEINELKRQYKSAKALVGVIPTSTESGSFVVEDLSTMTDLVNFDEDNTGLNEQQPKFSNVEYKIANYGAITPISKSFLQDETANFLTYLNGNFSKKAIRTENKKIFEALKLGKTAKAVADIKGLKGLVNKDLDPAIREASVFITNQDGFAYLDELEDGNNRPLLQPDPTQPTNKTLFGLPVHVFSNAELPTAGTTTKKAPLYVGSMVDAIKFFDRGVYEVAISEHAGFTKNQNVARCVERFDVKQADKDAYVYATIDVTGVSA